jgi:sugar lactone lactonase YvrE
MAGDLREVATGIFFGEGPRWRDGGDGGRLWFSDFYAHRVCSVSEAGGDLRTELDLGEPRQPSGLGWMPDGSLLVVLMRERQVWRRWPADHPEKVGLFELHADLSAIADHWCNDMVVDRQGRAYVGNFGFDLDAAMRDRGPAGVIADHHATRIALVHPDGRVESAAGDERLGFPNGAVITPDGLTLIVGETFGQRMTAFDILDGGTLANRRLWADVAPALPDGCCLDAEGAIWISNPAAPECRRIAEGGEVLEIVETGDPLCYACMLGGADGRTLFMMVAPGLDAASKAQGKVVACRVDVPAAGLP